MSAAKNTPPNAMPTMSGVVREEDEELGRIGIGNERGNGRGGRENGRKRESKWDRRSCLRC